jgi:hypothetical protein
MDSDEYHTLIGSELIAVLPADRRSPKIPEPTTAISRKAVPSASATRQRVNDTAGDPHTTCDTR